MGNPSSPPIDSLIQIRADVRLVVDSVFRKKRLINSYACGKGPLVFFGTQYSALSTQHSVLFLLYVWNLSRYDCGVVPVSLRNNLEK